MIFPSEKPGAKLILPPDAAMLTQYHCQAFENHAGLKTGIGNRMFPVPDNFSVVLVFLKTSFDSSPYAVAKRQHPGKRVIAYAIGEHNTPKGMDTQDFASGKTIHDVADKIKGLLPPIPARAETADD